MTVSNLYDWVEAQHFLQDSMCVHLRSRSACAISAGWSESSLHAWRCFGSMATQIGLRRFGSDAWMRRLIWVSTCEFVGNAVTRLICEWGRMTLMPFSTSLIRKKKKYVYVEWFSGLDTLCSFLTIVYHEDNFWDFFILYFIFCFLANQSSSEKGSILRGKSLFRREANYFLFWVGLFSEGRQKYWWQLLSLKVNPFTLNLLFLPI